jgi:CubicO group peptidase (beta-lactamase class C family)
VVVEVTGQSFEAFMQDNVLLPLGMTSSRISSDPDYARRMAKPHDKNGKPIPEDTTPRDAVKRIEDMARYGAAAALTTTPADYAKFFLAFIDPQPADNFRLNATSRQEMMRPQIKKADNEWEGLAWALEQHQGGPVIFTHAGQASGWYCMSAASTERRSGLMVMLNGDSYVPFLLKMLADPSRPVPPEQLWQDFAIRFFAA